MSNTIINRIFIIFITLFLICGCNSKHNTVSMQEKNIPPVQSAVSDTKTVKGIENLDGLDAESYDLSVTILDVADNTIKTADVRYDGDEKDRFSVKEYKILKNARFLQKEVNKTIYSNTNTSVTDEEYSVLTSDEFKSLVNSRTYSITAHLWLEKSKKCSVILIYGETIVWE